jgi:hypothetical protein
MWCFGETIFRDFSPGDPHFEITPTFVDSILDSLSFLPILYRRSTAGYQTELQKSKQRAGSYNFSRDIGRTISKPAVETSAGTGRAVRTTQPSRIPHGPPVDTRPPRFVRLAARLVPKMVSTGSSMHIGLEEKNR